MLASMGSLAAISLLVGGVGIMNIMLANMAERRQEIGLRRALGAARARLLRQLCRSTHRQRARRRVLPIGHQHHTRQVLARFEAESQALALVAGAIANRCHFIEGLLQKFQASAQGVLCSASC